MRLAPFILLLAGLPIMTNASPDATTAAQKGANWVIENAAIRVTVLPSAGRISVLEKKSGHEWKQPDAAIGTNWPEFKNVRKITAPSLGVAFEADLLWVNNKPNPVTVYLTVPASDNSLVAEADMPNRDTEFDSFTYLQPFVLSTPDAVVAMADYCDGHLYPVGLKPFPREWQSGGRLDMPWVGLTDLKTGIGCLTVLDTSDDATLHCEPVKSDGRDVSAPRVLWQSSKGKFAYPRRIIYHFLPKGGYVALAKAYRAYAKNLDLLVTLEEKVKHNINLYRLFGGPDVWGDATLAFAKEAKKAGIDKMLIQGRSDAGQLKAINELGYLTSEYDNYTDILPLEPGKEPDSSHDLLPDLAVMNKDGNRMGAWLTFDKKTQYMKRCPAFWVPTAKIVIPKVLKTFLFIGRFIDVTTAEGLYECYDPNHPLTRAEKRHCGEKLESYVESLGLVLGGEHGIWWGVPYMDYVEGMMSGGYYSWPAGHLIRPKTKDEQFTYPDGGKTEPWSDYAKWGIGYEWRAPLWELVFHDCIVTTWYWGDSNDYLLQAAPEITARKDAFNILYGTMPMMWADAQGGWKNAKETFLRTYRNVCKFHEVIATAEMLSHEFITPDHAVQQTKFSDGTRVIVNFGPKPYSAKVNGIVYLLPENGFVVKGPKITQSRAIADGKIVTRISQGKYKWEETE